VLRSTPKQTWDRRLMQATGWFFAIVGAAAVLAEVPGAAALGLGILLLYRYERNR
jgi:hypothetical protein